MAFPDERDAQRLAALALLHFKGLLAEEEAWMARLGRRSEDPRVQEATRALGAARRQLAVLYRSDPTPEALTGGLRAVNAAELKLGRLSRDYADHLQVRKSDLDALQGTLGEGEALVEFRRYRRYDFGKGYAEERWAGVIIEGFEAPRVVDLGAVGDVPEQVETLTLEQDGAKAAARALHAQLIAPLALSDHLGRVYLAPDDALHFLSFHRLLDAEDRYLGSERELRIVQSARDLLRPGHDRPARGLLALGGIDFGARPAKAAAAATDSADGDEDANGSEKRGAPETVIREDVAQLKETKELRSATARSFEDGFAPLESSGAEIEGIARLYRQGRPEEETTLWIDEEASEASLLGLKRAPRVLHLATHGFYRKESVRGERPMLLSGVALAGANAVLSGEREDGLLYALEAQGLNLEGTELVVLSACETGRGEVAYGEGVYGLVRALRTAGARQVLMTLRPIGDASAAAFMERFYTRWLMQGKGRSDVAQALNETRAHYIEHEPTFDWTPYVLVGL